MKRLFILQSGVVLSLLGLLLTATTSAQTPANINPDVTAKINEYMDALVKIGKFNGSLLIARDGTVVVSKGYGMSNFELDVPNTPQTKFRIGSITKPFTAISIMLLQQRGKLSVQDSICKYVADCPAGWQPITLHHLLSHSSGPAKHDTAADYLKTRVSRKEDGVEEIVSRKGAKRRRKGSEKNYLRLGVLLLRLCVKYP
jgi:CubicO group peptidase (beta-lactamase class C family)